QRPGAGGVERTRRPALPGVVHDRQDPRPPLRRPGRPDMKPIAIVVQRCHPNLAAGAEALAWQYALLLRSAYAVDVLTTTALDYGTWENELKPGQEVRDGVTVRRFPVTVSRSPYWQRLCGRLHDDYRVWCCQEGKLLGPRAGAWGVALQEEFIRHQGPYS